MRRAPQARTASRPATSAMEVRGPGPSPPRATEVEPGEAWQLQKTVRPRQQAPRQLHESEEPCSGDRTACPHPTLGRIYSRVVPSPFERIRSGRLELKLQHQTGATQGDCLYAESTWVGSSGYNLPHPPRPGVSIVICWPLVHRVLNFPGVRSSGPSRHRYW